jgi:hypothetical protein
LLHRFGLSTYRPTEIFPRLGNYVALADDGEWTLIADDLGYTLWRMPSTRPAIEALGQSWDVFACSIADCDDSFDFEYHRENHLVRRYVAADSGGSAPVVVENFGERLPGESTAFKQAFVLNIVLGVAASLGIRTDYTEQDVRVYVPTEVERPRGRLVY